MNFEKPVAKTEVKQEKSSFSDKIRKTFMGAAAGVAMMTGTESQAQIVTVSPAEFKAAQEQGIVNEFTKGTSIHMKEGLEVLAKLEQRADTTLEYTEAVNKVVEAFDSFKYETLTEPERQE